MLVIERKRWSLPCNVALCTSEEEFFFLIGFHESFGVFQRWMFLTILF
jgi:hypothetical protein